VTLTTAEGSEPTRGRAFDDPGRGPTRCSLRPI
jgi:hypothetical protein